MLWEADVAAFALGHPVPALPALARVTLSLYEARRDQASFTTGDVNALVRQLGGVKKLVIHSFAEGLRAQWTKAEEGALVAELKKQGVRVQVRATSGEGVVLPSVRVRGRSVAGR